MTILSNFDIFYIIHAMKSSELLKSLNYLLQIRKCITLVLYFINKFVFCEQTNQSADKLGEKRNH